MPRRVKITPPDTPFFSVRRAKEAKGDETNGGSGKVAAGMEVAFVVTFRPESMDDYVHDLIVVTEREKFIVPIVAVGATPALDLPEVVDFSSHGSKPTPVKIESKQILLVSRSVRSCLE